MVGFLRWLRSIMAAVLNGIAKFTFLLILIFAVLLVVGLVRGDGLPANTVLTMDLRDSMPDSATSGLSFSGQQQTVMNLVLALDKASRDGRIKGVVMRLGNGALSLAEAEEISGALHRFRDHKKFVIAQATGFLTSGLGDYVAAAAADQIWVQPHSDFKVSGGAAGGLFLKGLFDKIEAVPQIAKRAEYKSAADMYMEKSMSDADREQLTAVTNSWREAAVSQVAKDRRLDPEKVRAAFDDSPQFAEDARAKGLVDRIGYDDDALGAGVGRAGKGAKPFKITDYIRDQDFSAAYGANLALIEAAGEIVDGTAKGDLFNSQAGIASDDLSEANRQAARAPGIKAIVLRVDSPGGSVTASDQILDAVKKAQAKGKPVVVSMAGLGASGGYYISASADKIVAQPGTLTGSIGVLTGKVSVSKSLALAGVAVEQVASGKNTMMDSAIEPYTPEQWALLNRQADVIYRDFLQKVAAGRKLPFEQIAAVAKGRVWTGADAKAKGLVDGLGGFWTAADLAAGLGKIPADQIAIKIYPRRKGLLEGLSNLMGRSQAGLKALDGVRALMALPGIRLALEALASAPRGGVELKAVNLPREGELPGR
ncbi:MAG: signal peptide peptidase SppA [Alphaproteobacteria bacterium]|nr:signal peptide peptidase SppA [Alphaproteobacteria bacterium]